MGDGPIYTEILHTAVHYNIGGNIGNGLNFITCEQGLTVFYHSNGKSFVVVYNTVSGQSGLWTRS